MLQFGAVTLDAGEGLQVIVGIVVVGGDGDFGAGQLQHWYWIEYKISVKKLQLSNSNSRSQQEHLMSRLTMLYSEFANYQIRHQVTGKMYC